MYVYVYFDGNIVVAQRQRNRSLFTFSSCSSLRQPPAFAHNKSTNTSRIRSARLPKTACANVHKHVCLLKPDQRGVLLETSGLKIFSLQHTSCGFHLSPSPTIFPQLSCVVAILFEENQCFLSLSLPPLLSPVQP